MMGQIPQMIWPHPKLDQKTLLHWQGKKVFIVTKSGSRYFGTYGGMQEKNDRLRLNDLAAINKDGGFCGPSGSQDKKNGRWFRLENIKSIYPWSEMEG
jgi:hypothetical protein